MKTYFTKNKRHKIKPLFKLEMSFVINRVFPGFTQRRSNEDKVRDFEIQCAEKCQNLTPIEFKRWLDFEIERDLIKMFVMRKLRYSIFSNELTIDQLHDYIEKITGYIYRTYRSEYFTAAENIRMSTVIDGSYDSDDEEDQAFEDEMVNVLQSIRNGVTIRETPTSEMMSAAVENDIRSAILFSEMMATIRETTVLKRKFNIELEEVKKEKIEEKIECYVCFESVLNTTCIKQNCSHECCSRCLIKTINADKRPEPLCAMCRTPVKKLIVKTTDLKNELDELYN